MEKIPVKVVQTQDMHGNKKIGIMLDVVYYMHTVGNLDAKIQEFKKLYFNTLKKAKEVISEKRKRKKPSAMWKLSKILTEFNYSIKSEFFVTNYTIALQRDFGLTDSYVGIIFQFWKYFKEEEISDKIPFSNYFELILKKKQLSKNKLWETEKKRFLIRGNNGTLPSHKEYRHELKNLLNQP